MSDFCFGEFYDEPSEFELQMEEFKESLMLSVKKEYKEEMERLKKENARLQDIKNNWDKKVNELEQEKANLRIAQRDATQNAKKERLKGLLDAFKKQAWSYSYSYKYIREKCDKCDKDGRIHFKSPQGKDLSEECNCRKKILFYEPTEAEVVEFYDYDKDIRIVFMYKGKNIYNDGSDYCKTSYVYNGEDFESVNQYTGTVFYSRDDCQKYCDYINKKQELS